MTAAIIIILASMLPAGGLTPAEVDLGAAMVCAEARGASPMDRRAVAGVLRNRVAHTGGTLASVALAPRQFATPCPRRMVERGHAADFLAGWLGLGMPVWWSADVMAFQTHRSARVAGRKWRDVYGWRRVDGGRLAHTFWCGDMTSNRRPCGARQNGG